MATLADILTPSQWYSPENMEKLGYSYSPQQGRMGTSNDEGAYQPAGFYDAEGNPYADPTGVTNQSYGGLFGKYQSQLNQAGYKPLTPQERQRMETNMRNNGFNGTLEQAIAQAYPGSQIINDPNHGSLLQYGPGGAAGGNHALFGNWQEDDFMTKMAPMLIAGMAGAGLTGMLPGTTSIFGGGAAGAGAGAAAGGQPWYAGITDMAGGSLMSPGAAGSAYSGLGGAALGAGAGAGLSNVAPNVMQGLSESQLADIVAAEGGYSALPSSGMAGTAAGGGGSIWNSIFSGIRSATTSGKKGSLLENLIPGLLGAYSSNRLAGDLSDIANRSAAMADPFASQRGFYQDQLKQSYTDPNFLTNNPTFQAMWQPAYDKVRATAAGKGYNGSGNLLNDIQKVGTQTAAQYLLPWQQQTGLAAGANFGPGSAANVYSTNMTGAANADRSTAANIGYAVNPLLSSVFKAA